MSSQSQRNTPCRLGALSVAAGKQSEREFSIFLLEV